MQPGSCSEARGTRRAVEFFKEGEIAYETSTN